jgi:Tfp pilus assembly protein PilF
MKPVQRLQRAAHAYARRDLSTAEQECLGILASDPDDPDATHLLGLIRRLDGDVTNAEQLLRKSIDRAPNNAEFRVNLGNLLRATQRLGEAEGSFRAAISIDPRSRNARLALARLLNDSGVHAAAMTEAAQLVRDNGSDAEAWVALGVAQRRLGDLDAAETAYRRALTLRPDYAVARHNLGSLLGQTRRAEESLAELDRAAALGVSGRELEFNRGRALLELGRLDQAEGALAAAVRHAPGDVDAQLLLAKLRFMRGDADFVRDLTASCAAHPHLRWVIADLLRLAGVGDKAEAVLREIIRREGWTPQSGSGLAVVLQEQGRVGEALQEARRVLRARPDDSDICATVVALLLQSGRPDEAVPLIRQRRQLEPLDQSWLAYEATAARLSGDARYAELYDYDRFVRAFDLGSPPGCASQQEFNALLAEHLRGLHSQGFRTHPLDQSLRFGTQTSRSLLVDPSPQVRAFLEVLERPIAEYRELIGYDAGHPLLARNRGESKLAGCWSVRLNKGGHHVNHVHPQGWISSAYYVSVPEEVGDAALKSGWIKFGEPRMETPGAEAAHFVQPEVGKLVLFPSYMWHGTTPIQSGQERLTIAFDVVPTNDEDARSTTP